MLSSLKDNIDRCSQRYKSVAVRLDPEAVYDGKVSVGEIVERNHVSKPVGGCSHKITVSVDTPRSSYIQSIILNTASGEFINVCNVNDPRPRPPPVLSDSVISKNDSSRSRSRTRSRPSGSLPWLSQTFL